MCRVTKCDTITPTQTKLDANGYGRRLTVIRQANIGAFNNIVEVGLCGPFTLSASV